MGETLVLTSTDGHMLSSELIDSWLDANDSFVIRKNFIDNHHTVEITFIDDESMNSFYFL